VEFTEVVRTSLDGAASMHDLFEELDRMKGPDYWRRIATAVGPEKLRTYWPFHRVRHRRAEDPPSWDQRDRFLADVPKLQNNLQNRVGHGCLAHAIVDNECRETFFDFFAPLGSTTAQVARTLRTLCEKMCMPNGAREAAERGYRRGKDVRKLVESILAPLLPKKSQLFVKETAEFGPGEGGADSSFVLVDRGRSKRLEDLLRNLKAKFESQNYRWMEMAVLGEALSRQREWDYRMALLRGLEVVEPTEDLDSFREFDGACIDISQSQVLLHLIEAKNWQGKPEQAGAEASPDLCDKLSKLKWTAAEPVREVEYGAEATVVISYGKLEAFPEAA
jgi:hypothetical protein